MSRHFLGQAIGGRSDKEMINLVGASKRVHALVVRTSITYGGLGRYIAISESLATEVAMYERRAESEPTQENEIQVLQTR
jgi:hypothetical protein